MIIVWKIISKTWLKYFIQTNTILFLLMFSANTVSSLLRSNVTQYEIFLNQLITFPDILIKTIPISCLLTGMIIISNLVKTSELTALYSIGFPPKSFTEVIVKLSIIASTATILLAGFIQPKLLKLKSEKYNFLENKFRRLKKQGLISSKISNGKMWYRSENSFFNYASFNSRDLKLNKVEMFNIQGSKINQAYLAGALHQNKEKKWESTQSKKIKNIHINNFSHKDFIEEDMEIPIPINEEELNNLEKDILSLDIIKFKKYINQLERDGVSGTKYKVAFWQKISVSLSCIIFSLIGVIGLGNSNKRSQSLGMSIGATFIIIILYWFLDSFLLELGKSGKISVILATFGALLLTSLIISGKKLIRLSS